MAETRPLEASDFDGCPCDCCGNRYRVDVHVPDEMWIAIQPQDKPPGAGLLCGSCIMAAIEARGEFNYLSLTPPRPWLRLLTRDQQRRNTEASVGMSRAKDKAVK